MADDLRLSSGKRELVLTPPLVNAAGSLGFALESHDLVDLSRLGGFITNPISLRPRSPARDSGVLPVAGGFLLHSGLPNAGLDQTLARCRRRWAALPCPLVLHLIGDAGELERMILQVEAEPVVSGIEIGLEDLSQLEATADIARSSELPVILRLPLETPTAAFLQVVRAGVRAVSLGPPRGAWPTAAGAGRTGRLFGPALFPLVLRKVQGLADKLEIPLLAAGGVQEPGQIDSLRWAGAAAVQLDYALWLRPGLLLSAPAADA